MKTIIRTGILTLAIFVSFGFPAASMAFDDWMLQSDPNAGYMDGYILEAPPVEYPGSYPSKVVDYYPPPIEEIPGSYPSQVVDYYPPPIEEIPGSYPSQVVDTYPAPETPLTYTDTLAPEYPIYGPSYGGYPGFGYGGFGLGFGLGFGSPFAFAPAFISSPAIIQPVVIQQPAVATASASASAVATVTPVNTVPVPQYAAQYAAPTYVSPTYASPTYYTPPVQYAAQYTPPSAAPYVALTQIPYTGFDFGPLGNTLYWLSLVGFAVAGAYLLVYYLPSLKLRQAGLPTLKLGSADAIAFAGIIGKNRIPAGVTYIPAPKKDSIPVEAKSESYGGTRSAFAEGFGGTKDEMVTIQSSDGISAPRIVITRT